MMMWGRSALHGGNAGSWMGSISGIIKAASKVNDAARGPTRMMRGSSSSLHSRVFVMGHSKKETSRTCGLG